MELNADVVDGGNIAIAGADPDAHRHLGYLGHYNLFFTVHDTHDFNLGASGYYERGDHRAGLVAGGEVMYADRKFAADTDGDGVPDMEARNTPFAWYAFGQVQLNWHLYLGGRYDYACLLYTSDAADERSSVDLGGR